MLSSVSHLGAPGNSRAFINVVPYSISFLTKELELGFLVSFRIVLRNTLDLVPWDAQVVQDIVMSSAKSDKVGEERIAGIKDFDKHS